MTPTPDLPVRYSELDRRRNAYPAARPPCEIRGCTYVAKAGSLTRRGLYVVVYDHCHKHDRLRGVLCRDCNNAMHYVDAHVAVMISCRGPHRWEPLWPGFLAHWARCPECAAAGPWEPWLTRREYGRMIP